MDMATPVALGTRMVRIRIIAHKDLRGYKFVAYTIRKNLLNWFDLVSISKNVVFYAFRTVRIYQYLADLLQKNVSDVS